MYTRNSSMKAHKKNHHSSVSILWINDGYLVEFHAPKKALKVPNFEDLIDQKVIMNRLDFLNHIIDYVLTSVVEITSKIKCDKCKERFINEEKLNKHQMKDHKKNHTADGNVTFSCNNCEKQFTHPKNLSRHYRLTHGIKYKPMKINHNTESDNPRFKCNQCDKQFAYKRLTKVLLNLGKIKNNIFSLF